MLYEVITDPAVRSAYLGEDQGRPAARRGAAAPAGPGLLDVGRLEAGYGAPDLATALPAARNNFV